MNLQQINLGSTPTGGDGDTVRSAFAKTNQNSTDISEKFTAVDTAVAGKMPANPGGGVDKVVMGSGALDNAINPRWQIKSSSGPMLEFHIPGSTALGNFMDPAGNLYWARTDGGGSASGAARMYLTPTGSLSILGTLSQGSDYRLKTDVIELDPDDVLERVMRFRGVEYTSIFDPDGGRLPGGLAHEVSEAFPLLVQGTKDAVEAAPDIDGKPVARYQRMNYVGLVVYTTVGLQATVRRLEAAEKTIGSLVGRIEALERMMPSEGQAGHETGE
ncbi:hypothetical protein PPN31114_00252 [Pandoraea pneumonica]|uniref:Peptidase S74 domain-containing protein n=1 Tax=Pandoraea pneumonica TaxID=2508299 RepID=A0A5E4RNQ1_9BURK|nr:tail fiber domain-containing protein [Pandoraea pneumonica]VVD64032.1 hypothetical protein PPN31114_00252 [Pandoraea pneumonica]